MHRLEYILEGREATAIRGVMHFDLNGYDWPSANADTRVLGIAGLNSRFAQAMANEARKRRAALHRVPAGEDRDMVADMIDVAEFNKELNVSGLLELHLQTPPARADMPVPEEMILRFPPMGKTAGVNNDVLGITAQTPTGDRIAEWVYKVTDADPRVTGIGPAPVIVEQDRADLKTLSDRMVAGDRLFFRVADEKQSTLQEVALPLGYDRATEYAAMASLQPVAQQAARAKRRRADTRTTAPKIPRGGTCEKRGRFLTIASVGTVGLPDDCRELATLRAFHDGWLARHPGGAALTARYYRMAPMLVRRIDRRADARGDLAARLGLRRGARRAVRADGTEPPGAMGLPRHGGPLGAPRARRHSSRPAQLSGGAALTTTGPGDIVRTCVISSAAQSAIRAAASSAPTARVSQPSRL